MSDTDMFVVGRLESCDVPPMRFLKPGENPSPVQVVQRFTLVLRNRLGHEVKLAVDERQWAEHQLGACLSWTLHGKEPRYGQYPMKEKG
jgi:hypothetical protein